MRFQCVPTCRWMTKSQQQTYHNSPKTWLIDLPPWVTDMPPGGHRNGRVMREWWDLPAACSTRPFACEVGCQREPSLPVVAPAASGLCGEEPQTTGELELLNQKKKKNLQDSDFIRHGVGMKNKNNKTEINRLEPRGIQTSWGLGRRWSRVMLTSSLIST